MKFALYVILVLTTFSAITSFSKARSDDYPIIDITSRNPQATIIPPEYATEMGREEGRIEAVNSRLDSIDQSIKDMRGDIKELMATNNVLNFLIKVFELLIPGMIITAFGFWLKNYWESKRTQKAV